MWLWCLHRSDYFLRWSARPSIPVDWYSKTWRAETDPIADVDRYVPWMAFEAAGRNGPLPLPTCEDPPFSEGEGSEDEDALQSLEEAKAEVRRLRALVKERDRRLADMRAGGQWLPTGGYAEGAEVQGNEAAQPFMCYEGAPEVLLFD